jgi:DNA-binding SARP family transcriptional activator
VEFRILGPLQILDGDTPIEITGAKQQAVLTMLILRANEMIGSERLIDELWGEQAPRNATGALYNHVSRLRKALGPDLIARREWGYVLRTPPESIDLRRFEAMVSEAEQLPARQRAARLAEALALWRGPPLAGLESEAALQREIARLEEIRVATIERRIDADLETGRNSDLVGELEMLIAEHPVREHLRWQLILALYRAGRQAEALEVYRETRRVLAEELGLDPSPELRELEKAILRQDPSLAIATGQVPEPRAPAEQSASRPPRRRLSAGLLVLGVLASGAAAVALVVATDNHAPAVAVPATTVINESPPQTTIVIRSTSGQPRSRRHGTKPTTARPTRPSTAPVAPGATTTGPPNPPTTNTHSTTSKPPAHKRTTAAPTTTTTPKTATTAAAGNPNPPPKLTTISDTFDGGILDDAIWSTYRSDANVAIAQTTGQLQITVGGAAQPGGDGYISGQVSTLCTFSSDFDARVDYKLLEWPVGDNVFVGIVTQKSGVGRSSGSNEVYASWAGTIGLTVPLPDTSGSLRLARVNDVVSGYIWHNGGWQMIASGTVYGAEAFSLLALWNPNTGTPFGRQEVKVAFDNFTVTGADPSCPSGSQPPSS